VKRTTAPAHIAANWMTTFYGLQFGALETQELRTEPVPFWLLSFADTVKGAIHQLSFAVVLPDGTVVEPSVTKRLYALKQTLLHLG
jgi:hypothetical protein